MCERFVLLQKYLNKVLSIADFGIYRLTDLQRQNTLRMPSVLRRLKTRDIEVATVIDVGASNGCWSQKMLEVYPDARYLLVEANPVHEVSLQEFVGKNKNADYVLAVAGEAPGSIYFDASDPFGGMASSEKSAKFNQCLPCVTLDGETDSRKLGGPYLVKLDTHGFEVPILNGAEKVLEETSVLFVETYNFDIEESSLRFWEMCQFLYERGFRPIDLCEPMHRPKDESFWQIDIVFVKRSRVEFFSNSYA